MAELKFQKFTNLHQRQENRISVTSSNSFGFPRKFFKDNKIGRYKYVVLYYDRRNKAVGFYFTNSEEEKYKFSIIRSKQGYGGSVVTTSFFKTYNLNSRLYRGKYDWEKKKMEGIGELFIIQLKERKPKQTNTEEI